MSATLTLVRWAGGKSKQLKQLLPFIPDGKVFVEPFGGGAAVLLNRPRSPIEVYNDLDGSLVNLFRVVRDPATFDRLAAILGWTPYSRREFEDARGFEAESDPVLAAAKFYTVLNQAISGKRLADPSDWARTKVDNAATRWVLRQEKLGLIHSRLQHVQIESRDALDILQEWDTPETVFYCDPPYVLETRSKKYYAVEPGDDFHKKMVEVLLDVKGRVVLSGYNHPLYDPLLAAGWTADSYQQWAAMTPIEGKGERDTRQEVVWRNRAAVTSGILVPLPLEAPTVFEDEVDPDEYVECSLDAGDCLDIECPVHGAF